MAKIISVVNQKGGTGKTTSAVNLGGYLSTLGKYVLLVDLDPQANASSGVGIDGAKASVYQGLVNEAEPQALIKPTAFLGYDILPSASELAGANVDLVNMSEREWRLHNLLDKIRANYDYIIIDCPPALGLLTINGLTAADELIIPVQCEFYAMEGLSKLLSTVDIVNQNLDKELDVLGVLLTMYDKRNKLAREVRKQVELNFPGRVFNTIIPRNVSLAEAPSFGQTILQYDPRSRGARAYKQLAQEVISLA